MWFKQLSVFLLNKEAIPTFDQIQSALQEAAFVPPQGLDWFSEGFVPPIHNQPDLLVFQADGTYRVVLRREDKVLPAVVIRDVVDQEIEQIQANENRIVGRKEKQEIKDNVTDDLLPRAFTKSSSIQAVIDPKHGYLFINQASSAKAENLLSKLRQALSGLDAKLLKTKQSPGSLMTEWLTNKRAIGGFELDTDCELKGLGAAAPVIKAQNQDLTADEVTSHLDTGKVVTQIGLTWQDQVRFILTQDFTLKRIQYLDVLQEEAANHGEDATSLMLASQMLMCEALGNIMGELIEHCGGLDVVNDVDQPSSLLFSDSEYQFAKEAVTNHQIASISHIQRQLRIGYNKAAQIMNELQVNGIVSAPDNNGQRTVLVKP